jgi:hypothetical protein
VVGVGDVDDQRLYARPPDCVGVAVAPDTRKDVKLAPGQLACRGRAYAGRRTGYHDDLLGLRRRCHRNEVTLAAEGGAFPAILSWHDAIPTRLNASRKSIQVDGQHRGAVLTAMKY